MSRPTNYPEIINADPSLWRPMDREPLPGSQSAAEYEKAEAAKRKTYPLATGVIDYFPDALMEIAHLSKVGNDQHNPGEPLHWAREKSTDHSDALARHFKDRYTRDRDGERHATKVAWRALAFLQDLIEKERNLLNNPLN